MSLFKQHETGQGLVEYALIIVLIAIVVIVAMQFLAPTIGNVFTEIGNTLQGVSSGNDDSGQVSLLDLSPWHDSHDHNHDH
jgi:pilus assembly protein Flp/PilA